MEFQAANYTIDRLIQWIRTGRLALPDFQRDFVWNPARVVELLDSVARQWPIGSLLLLRGPQPFGVKEIHCAPRLGDTALDIYVLDGQQRITSLYHAVTNVSDFCYYIDFTRVLEDSEDYIKWEKRQKFETRFATLEDRSRNKIALVADLWDSANFFKWIDTIRSDSEKQTLINFREQFLSGLQTKVYKVIAIELEQSIQLEALARIFETLNRTGVRLNAFDLMVAALYPSGFNLREEWLNAQAENELLLDFDIDPAELLKLTALLIREKEGSKIAPGVRQGDILSIERNLVVKNWPTAVDLYSVTLEFARSNLGISGTNAIPSTALMLGVAIWLRKGGDAASIEALKAWYWGSCFSQQFAQAVNTRVVADAERVLGANYVEFATNRLKDAQLQLNEEDLADRASVRATFGLLAQAGGLDPLSGKKLCDIQEFATAVVRPGRGLEKAPRNSTINELVFLDKKSSQALRRAKFVLEKEAIESFERRLNSQYISEETGRRSSESLIQLIDAAVTAPTI